MNILVTGGRGQLGMSIKKVSGEYSRHLFIFTDMPEADITSPEVMDRLIEEHKADAVVNCAAYTAVDKAESEPGTAELINTMGAQVLARTAVRHSVPLVHISTDYVFDGLARKPYRESDPTNPTGVYGLTKLAGERAIERTSADAVIIRTAWLYSEFGNNFVKTMLRLAETRTEVGVVADQTGTPTYAPDLARAVVKIIENGIRGVEIYHYSNEGEITWADFAQEIFHRAGTQVKVNRIATSDYPTPARRPSYSVLDKSKVKAAGVTVPPWKDSLAVCIEALSAGK